MFNFIKRHWVVSVIVLLNIIAVPAVIIAIVSHNTKTAVIDIYVAPSNAMIELNGKTYENLRSYDVAPGDYHVKISMDGMQTKEFDFTLENNGFYKIKTYLLDADGKFEYYIENPDEQLFLQATVDDDPAVKKFLTDYNRVWSITNVLPLTFANTYDVNAIEIISISIDLGEGDECKEKNQCLIISDYTGKNHAKALQMIKDAGYNPDDYEIVFKEGLD